MATKPSINTTYAYTTGAGNNRTYMSSRSIKYIIIHYTATNASAKNNCQYFKNNSSANASSADFFVDKSGAIYQSNKDISHYVSWQAGNWNMNMHSIGIECVNDGSSAFTNAQIAALQKLVPWLMSVYSVPASRVIRHYDVSDQSISTGSTIDPHKLCPKYYAASGGSKYTAWKNLHAKITSTSGATTSTSGTATAAKTTTTITKKALSVKVTYSLRMLTGNKWLSSVVDFNNTNENGYAGYEGRKHNGFKASISAGSIKYKVHTLGGSWSSWYKDGQVASTGTKPIDGISIYYTTPSGYTYQQAWYRSSTTASKGYLGVCCDDGSDNDYDGWCGEYGKPLDKIQIKITSKKPF